MTARYRDSGSIADDVNAEQYARVSVCRFGFVQDVLSVVITILTEWRSLGQVTRTLFRCGQNESLHTWAVLASYYYYSW